MSHAYDRETRNTMTIDRNSRLERDPNKAERTIWSRTFEWKAGYA